MSKAKISEKEEIKNNRNYKKSPVNNGNNKDMLLNIFLVILLGISLLCFIIVVVDKNCSIVNLITNFLLTVFTICFVSIGITYNGKKKGLLLLGSLLLVGYYVLEVQSSFQFLGFFEKKVPDFRGKNVTEVIQWASKNKVSLQQEYEYSDMVSEYQVISQEATFNEKKNKLKDLTISISEGANPSKEIMVPSMISWNSERVLAFIKENYLSNVVVEFTSSDKAKDTVIEQSMSGSLKRDDELKLIFSYGEELGFDEVTLIDFKNKSRFEVEFYMKQNQLRYEFVDEFHSSIKKGRATKQDHEAGSKVHINDDKIVVTISKGPEIKVPNLEKMSLTEITKWAIKNKIKLNFSDKYDDKIKENKVIEASSKEGDVIEQGSTLKIVISKGGLKMQNFKSLSDFYSWANKYNINYEEEHEFSDTVPAGEVIRYSYKNGEIIKNNDSIKVIISDGEKKTVPNLKGLNKDEAISKLEKLGFKYSFVYNSSNSVKKNYVISQSISPGSEISSGTTITITLSTGEKDATTSQRKTENKSNSNSSNNTNNNNNNNNNSNDNSGNTSPAQQTTPPQQSEPEPEKVTIYIYDELIKSSPAATCSAIKGRYAKLNFSCSYVCGPYNGALVNSSSIDEHTFSTTDTINLRISDDSKC